jgi:WD40 repeat protein
VPANTPLRPISGASLGLAPAPIDDTEPPEELLAFELPQPLRYTDGGLIGRGGMGEIRSVHDGRLGRTIAFKTPVGRDRSAAQQLIAEATLTARLVHPGIVAVHDAGRAPDGRPYYTMPIVHGRSLAEAIDGASSPERLRLVRHFLDACEAIAYAHSQGVLHRDLKPSNILVGRFGETVVVDWGLAGPVGERAPGVVGTPAYMPPEQARGQVLEPTADVFALGVTLREILTGRADEHVEPGTPPELSAIVERATRAVPAARYADGHALAEDVAAWFEGRRVAAHRYSLHELLARAWAAHRVPLTIALLAVVGITIATAVGVRRTALEHTRAEASERAAVVARERSDRSLVQAELAQAQGAMSRDEWPQAELLAAGALMHGPSVVARGVLARFDPTARPRLLRRSPLPMCARLVVSTDGGRLACARDEEVRIAGPGASWDAVAPRQLHGDPLALMDTGDRLVVDDATRLWVIDTARPEDRVLLQTRSSRPRQLFAATPGRLAWVTSTVEMWADLETRRVEQTEHCQARGHGAAGAVAVRGDGARLLACQDGTVLVEREAAGVRELGRLSSSLGGPVLLALSQPQARLAAVGLAGGSVVVLDLDEGRILRTFTSDAGTPFDLALTGSRLAVSDGRGSVHVWEIDGGTLLVRLMAPNARVRWLGDDQHLRVIGRAIEDWALPSQARPHVRATGSGISALSLAPDGRTVVTAHGDGHVRRFRLDRDDEPVEIPLHWSVVKDVELSPDGREAVAACAQDDRLHVLDLDDPSRSRSLPATFGPRVAWLAGAQQLLAPYQGGLAVWDAGVASPSPGPGPDWQTTDMESDADRRSATLLGAEGSIVRLTTSPRVATRMIARRSGATMVAGHHERVVVASPSMLEVIEADGRARMVALTGAPATDIALSPDGQRLAVGHLDGSVWVWSATTLEPLAVLQGHVSRVSALAFDATGERLVTGSWDGDVRQWSLRALEQPAAQLLHAAETAWGLTLEQLLASQASPTGA